MTLRAGPNDQIVHAAGETGALAIGRTEIFDQGHFRKFVRHDERVRKNRGVLSVQPVKGFERQLDLDAARHVKKSSRPHKGLVERGELCGTENGRLTHEMPSEQIFMLDHCSLERLKDDTGGAQFFRKDIALDKMIVGKNEAARGFVETGGTFKNFAAAPSSDNGRRRHIRRKVERSDV